jgi:hypothetical protein
MKRHCGRYMSSTHAHTGQDYQSLPPLVHLCTANELPLASAHEASVNSSPRFSAETDRLIVGTYLNAGPSITLRHHLL